MEALPESRDLPMEGDFEEFCDLKNVPVPKSLDELIKELHKVFSSDKVNIDYVQTMMTSYKSNPRDWKKFAKFDTHRYTRNLVDKGNGRFNLMVLCWNESQGSSIHAHANSHCFLKVLEGKAREELFDWPNSSEGETEMTKLCDNEYERDACAYMCDEKGLHRVENPSHSEKLVTLHLYSPPFQECKTFDQKTGKCNISKTTFWSEFGKRTPFGKGKGKGCEVVPENN